MLDGLVTLAYLVAASLFILGLKRLGSPRTARAGNRMAAVGMLVGVAAALVAEQILNPTELVGGLVVGSAIGLYLARRTPLTEMPELVAAFNGFGGHLAGLLVGGERLRVAARVLGVGRLEVQFDERRADRLDLLAGRGPHVVGRGHGAQPTGCCECLESGDACAEHQHLGGADGPGCRR